MDPVHRLIFNGVLPLLGHLCFRLQEKKAPKLVELLEVHQFKCFPLPEHGDRTGCRK